MTKNLFGLPAFHTQEAFEMPVASSKLILPSAFFFPNSFSSRGSYFKLGGEGSQILWIRCGGGCHRGSRWRCRLVCVGVRVRLSHRLSLAVSSGVCRGQGSQIQDRAVVTQGVVGGVIF